MSLLTDHDLELIHSALRYYAVNGGSRRDLTRMHRRRERASWLADRLGELGLTVDEDGTGSSVRADHNPFSALHDAAGCAEYALMTGSTETRDEALRLLGEALGPGQEERARRLRSF